MKGGIANRQRLRFACGQAAHAARFQCRVKKRADGIFAHLIRWRAAFGQAAGKVDAKGTTFAVDPPKFSHCLPAAGPKQTDNATGQKQSTFSRFL